MSFSGKIVNNSYIIREKVYETEEYSVWETQSIYSVKKFLLLILKNRFIKSEIDKAKKILEDYSLKKNDYEQNIFEANTYLNLLFISVEFDEGLPFIEYIRLKENSNFNEVIKILTEILKIFFELEKTKKESNFYTEESLWIATFGNEIKNIKIISFGLNEIKNILNLKRSKKKLNYTEFTSNVLKKLLNYSKNNSESLERIFNGIKLDKIVKEKYIKIFKNIINLHYKNAGEILNEIIINTVKKNIENSEINTSGYQNQRDLFFGKDKNSTLSDRYQSSQERIDYFNRMNSDRKNFYEKADINELNIYFKKIENERNKYFKKISEGKKNFIDKIINETKKYFINIEKNKRKNIKTKTLEIIQYYQNISESTKELIDFVSYNKNEWTQKLKSEIIKTEDWSRDKVKNKNNYLNSMIYNIDRYTENVAVDTKRYFINLSGETRKHLEENKFLFNGEERDYKKNVKSVINDIIIRTEKYFTKIEENYKIEDDKTANIKKDIVADNIKKTNKNNSQKIIKTQKKIIPVKKIKNRDSSGFDFLSFFFKQSNKINFIYKLAKLADKNKGNICFIKVNFNESFKIIDELKNYLFRRASPFKTLISFREKPSDDISSAVNIKNNFILSVIDCKTEKKVLKKISLNYYKNKKNIIDKIKKGDEKIISNLFISEVNKTRIIVLQNLEFLDEQSKKILTLLTKKITGCHLLIIGFYKNL